MNGTPLELPPVVDNVGNLILECAQTFNLVEEAAGSELEQVRARARNAIYNAERVFFLGFNFDPSNVSAIGLQDAQNREPMFCLNFDGNLGLKRRMIRLGIPEHQIHSGSRDNPLHIEQALDDGFLEQ